MVAGASAVDLKRGLDRGLRAAVTSLRALSRPVASRREKAQVATISAHTRNVRTCRLGESLSAAARIMWEGDCGCVPIVDQDERGARVIGIITDRDICMAGYTQGRPLSAIKVESAMARHVHSCRATDSINEALTMLRKHQLHRLAVVDDGDHLVGMLSLADAAREAVREHGRKGRDGHADRRGARGDLRAPGAARRGRREHLRSARRRRNRPSSPGPSDRPDEPSWPRARAVRAKWPARLARRSPTLLLLDLGEAGGRRLKLVSGVVMLALGTLLLVG